MDQLKALSQRVSRLGNYYQKFLHIINRNKDDLIHALESSGKLMQVHLWRSSFSPTEEMKIISKLAKDSKTKVRFISCYYALQFLHMNFRNLDILELGITSGVNVSDEYRNFMAQIGNDFRELTGAYLKNLLDIYLPKDLKIEYFLISVGTRADQDDIDIGVITTDDSDHVTLNNAMRKVTQDMLVYATPLHHYLSEHVGTKVYITTISEYKEVLEKRFQDVIVITEILNAKLILGSESLFRKFQREVIAKYYYHHKKDVILHERFIRGILGESRGLLLMPLQKDAITPKSDALRVIKSLLYAKRTIHTIKELTPWEIIPILMKKEPELRSEYELLSKATSFLEVFKFLLQMYIIQEETFNPDEIHKDQLALIAQKMGYEPIGTVNAWNQLIIDYYRYVKEVRKVCDFLIKDISLHLSSVSMFKKMLNPEIYLNSDRNLAKEFIFNAQFFVGTKYWEDLLGMLEIDKQLLYLFIKGFEQLQKPQQNRLIQRYVEWAKYSPTTLIRLITIIGKKQKNIVGDSLFCKINLFFLKYFIEAPYINERICRIFSLYPQYIHEYLQLFPEDHYKYLDEILARPVIDNMLKEYQIQLQELFTIHKFSSLYFHRFFYRIILNHPEYLKALTNMAQFQKISSGLLAMVSRYPSDEQKKKVLGDYYDLEFLRIGIGTIKGVKLETTNIEFTEFCDNYIQKLFDICTEEVAHESESDPPNTDTFAILAAGGHARGQAYDDDYDLIAIVDTNDEKVVQHATRVISRMNREIVKRGVLPHYRLGEILGGFVNPVEKIVEYLKSDDDESFIDLSQLLVARIIVGSNVIRNVINNKILQPLIFDSKSFYIKRMIHEVRNRHLTSENCRNDQCNIKEMPGGLRDIEAIALILKAYLGIGTPLSHNFFKHIRSKFPEIKPQLDILSKSEYFLRTIRNLYRITVAAEDNIQAGYLNTLSEIFYRSKKSKQLKPVKLKNKIQQCLNTSAKACKEIIEYFEKIN